MKRIRNSRAARILSWFLTWTMVLPLVTGLIAPRSASAQQPAPAPVTNSMTVIVIDFANKSKTGGDALARFATDAVAVELASSGRFEVLRREEVARAAETLGYRAPFDQAQLARLAQQLGANAIVTGEVSKVTIEQKRGVEKNVTVGLKVRVMDPSSGELINGAAELGGAVAKPGLSDDEALAQEAISKAAVNAIHNINRYQLPEGTVLNTVGTPPDLQVLVNRGSRDGVQIGQDLIVLRSGVRVGRIRVTNAF
ncbi:MAG: hypothetical protein HY248_00185, partial [Fimbriimonas ginsengisoli]|nr:hypothetical protein [Fimbriimonas ginsengisoli]